MNKFMIDTADVDYIANVLDFLNGNGVDLNTISGVTTNPNAMKKVGATSFSAFRKQLQSLAGVMRSAPQAKLHTQFPKSTFTMNEINTYVEVVNSYVDAPTVVKIPPFPKVLETIRTYDGGYNTYNVTGTADYATAVWAAHQSTMIGFVSLIPGRMAERGIDYEEHCIRTVRGVPRHVTVIAGSMRTVDQVRETIEFGMVPTIGARVWDLAFSDDAEREKLIDALANAEYQHTTLSDYSPYVTQDSIDLSREFFEQMDACGHDLYEDMIG